MSVTVGYLQQPIFDRIPFEKGYASLLQFLEDPEYLSTRWLGLK